MRPFIALCLAASASTAVAASPSTVVKPFEDARFTPDDPARPDGTRVAVLEGDPASGPSDMLMLMKRGEGVRHIHSSDYRLVVLRGAMKHWSVAEPRAKARVLGPGGYWLQPGGQAHGDDCLSDECLMFISWSGPRDGWLAKD
jgi:hypothetical protein